MSNTASRVLQLAPGESAIFGYGSLLSRTSMERTLGRPYEKPRVACSLNGWRRSWDVIMPNTNFFARTNDGEFVPEHIVYLNIRPSDGTPVNGLLYVVGLEELRAFDGREWIYDRVTVTSQVGGVTVRGGDAYAYVGKREWQLDPGRPQSWAALRQTYLDIVETGLRDQPPAEAAQFRAQYDESTDAVPLHRVFADQLRA